MPRPGLVNEMPALPLRPVMTASIKVNVIEQTRRQTRETLRELQVARSGGRVSTRP
jgi:hypothetical protein